MAFKFDVIAAWGGRPVESVLTAQPQNSRLRMDRDRGWTLPPQPPPSYGELCQATLSHHSDVGPFYYIHLV